jgi:ketosteroid isomerase-like protein
VTRKACRAKRSRIHPAEHLAHVVGQFRATKVRPCKTMGASAIHVRCMDELTKDAVREIEQIHSSWMEFEVAGQGHSLMALCADDIELWPPDARPLLGRTAVLTQMAHGTTRIHRIEITDCLIRGSNEIAYLTASYKTTFSPAEDSTPRQALGSHLWILRKRAGTWVVTLVSWSLWGLDAIP